MSTSAARSIRTTDKHNTAWHIVAARNTMQLVSWGDHLGTNCIGNGGYNHLLENRHDVLLGVYKNNIADEMIAWTTEITVKDDGTAAVMQHRGYNNNHVTNDEWFLDLLDKHGITTKRK